MIHLIATRKITAFLFAMVWLAFVGQGTGYGQPPVEEGKIYWTNPVGGIQRANLDGTNVEQLVESDLRRPAEIALDLLRGKIYWTDRWNIYRSDLDGSNLNNYFVGVGATNIALDVLGGKFYWMANLPEYDHPYGYVARGSIDGFDSEVLFEGSRPWDIALDLVRGKVYWTDLSYDGILRADLDGQNVEYDYIRPDSDFLGGIALDVDGSKIYWTNPNTKTIQRAGLDGQNIEDVLTISDGYPEEITLDVDGSKIYWTNPGTQTIQRADLDGQNIEILFNLAGDVLYTDWGPRIGIALDVDGSKIYWADSRWGTLQRADLDGQNIEILFNPIVRRPHGIALHWDKMYWTDDWKGTIQRADLDGQNLEVLISGLNSPRDIALLAEDKIYWTEAEVTRRIRKYRVEPDTWKIQSADLDGSNVEEVLTGLSHLGDIALDGVRDKIYWTESFRREQWEHTIQRADLDGSNVESILSELAREIALDVLAGKIYWIDIEALRRAELDGSNVETIVTRSDKDWGWGSFKAFALDLTGNKIYLSHRADGLGMVGEVPPEWTEFFRSNLDGSNLEEIWTLHRVGGTSPAPTDLALDISHPTPVSTPDTTPARPATSGLSPNYPNPFNASTQIAYHLATSGPVRLTIYNTLGQPVRTLVDQFQAAGFYQVPWDARDQRGTALAAGVYLVRLHYPGGEQTRRLLLLK